MKHVPGLVAFLVLLPPLGSALAAGDIVRQCQFTVKARCASGDARVTLADGALKRIEIGVHWCGAQRGHPGYDCTIDASRGDQDSTWSEDGGATLIANKSPWNANLPDRVKVTVGKAVSIDLEEAQSLGRCGTGAELPRAIVIPAEKKVCRVWLNEP